jgi:recombination protein RecA
MLKGFKKVEGARLSLLTDKEVVAIPRLSTGSLGLDHAIGGSPKYLYGLPRGRIIELYGPESSGKTTVGLSIIARAQEASLLCAFIDVEHAADLTYFQNCGVQIDQLLFSQPDFGEAALSLVEDLAAKAVDVIVVDSVAALLPKAELEGELGDSHVALQARLMSQALRKLNGIAEASGTMVVFINQIREKVGVFFGNPEVTPGGRALKFYASVRMEVRRKDILKSGERAVGHRTLVKVVKNKVGPPLGEASFPILWGRGVDSIGELLELSFVAGVTEKAGAWWSYKGERMGQGYEAAREYLEKAPEVFATLRAETAERI